MEEFYGQVSETTKSLRGERMFDEAILHAGTSISLSLHSQQ